MITVLVDHVFRVPVVVVVVDAVVVVAQHRRSAVSHAVLDQVLPVRFRLEPEHFHFVGVHGTRARTFLSDG